MLQLSIERSIQVLAVVILSIYLIDTGEDFAQGEGVANGPFLGAGHNYSKGQQIIIQNFDWPSDIMKVFNPDGKPYLSTTISPNTLFKFNITGDLGIPGYYQISTYYNNTL
ncbi:MAG: hypothetical protein WBF38_01595 [Nitrosotalea sp.]